MGFVASVTNCVEKCAASTWDFFCNKTRLTKKMGFPSSPIAQQSAMTTSLVKGMAPN